MSEPRERPRCEKDGCENYARLNAPVCWACSDLAIRPALVTDPVDDPDSIEYRLVREIALTTTPLDLAKKLHAAQKRMAELERLAKDEQWNLICEYMEAYEP